MILLAVFVEKVVILLLKVNKDLILTPIYLIEPVKGPKRIDASDKYELIIRLRRYKDSIPINVRF